MDAAKTTPALTTPFCFEDVANSSSEDKLLWSYDRFYKAVNKIVCKDVDLQTPLPTLECILQGDAELPREALKDLSIIWDRAERFHELQSVAMKFHRYRSDLVKKWKRRSRTASISSTEVEDGMRELQTNQSRLEGQLNFANALLVSVDQRTEQLPGLMTEVLKKLSDDTAERENIALKQMVFENQKKIDRLEQLMMKFDAKMGMWNGDGQRDGMKFASGSWPETMHNNIAYSSSVSSSMLEGATSETSRPVSTGPVEESSDEDTTSETNALKESTTEMMKTGMDASTSGLKSEMCESGAPTPEIVVPMEALPELSHQESMIVSTEEKSDSEGCLLPSIKPISFFNGAPSTARSLAFTQSTFSILDHNKVEDSIKAGLVEDQKPEKRGMSLDFNDAFLQDALRVQENILTSDLGRQGIIPPIPRNDHSPSKTTQTNIASTNKPDHLEDQTGAACSCAV